MFSVDLYTDIQWLHNISFRLDNFKKGSSSNLWVSRCPICGDSKHSKKKARLYFYTKEGKLNFHCKNCNASGSFWTFMKTQCQDEFEEYKKSQILDRFKKKRQPTFVEEPVADPQVNVQSELVGCVPILSLPNNHQALKYLAMRKFDYEMVTRLFYSENFKITADALSITKLNDDFPKEPRIVIPFWSEDGKQIEVIQGRSLNQKSKLRYITIKSSDSIGKIYGKNFIDKSKTVYCVEGPFDSMFVENCIATCDSNLLTAEADVYIWDNESRNKEIIRLMETAIDLGKTLVIWPVSTNKKVDINDMIKLGLTRQDLMKIIKERTFSGLKAKLELTKWRKV